MHLRSLRGALYWPTALEELSSEGMGCTAAVCRDFTLPGSLGDPPAVSVFVIAFICSVWASIAHPPLFVKEKRGWRGLPGGAKKKDALRLRPEGIFYEVCLFVRAAQTRGCGSDILRSGRSITEVPMAKHTVLTELVGTVPGGNGPVKKGVHWVWLAISNSWV